MKGEEAAPKVLLPGVEITVEAEEESGQVKVRSEKYCHVIKIGR